MEPASAIIGIAATAASLAALAARTVLFVTRLRDTYANLDLVVLDLYTTCQAFEIASRNISTWAQAAPNSFQSQSALAELLTYLKTSHMVLELVQADLARNFTKQSRPGAVVDLDAPLRKVQLLLHVPALREHCARLDR